MALLKCPECEKDVSSEADYCIHCGYPLKQKTIINGVSYDLTSELNLVLCNRNIEAIKSVRDKTGLGLADGKSIIDYMVSNKKIPTVFTFQEKQSNVPRCPTCNSTNIEKISDTSKVVGAVAFGLFSKTAKSQFKCRNCGAKW